MSQVKAACSWSEPPDWTAGSYLPASPGAIVGVGAGGDVSLLSHTWGLGLVNTAAHLSLLHYGQPPRQVNAGLNAPAGLTLCLLPAPGVAVRGQLTCHFLQGQAYLLCKETVGLGSYRNKGFLSSPNVSQQITGGNK